MLGPRAVSFASSIFGSFSSRASREGVCKTTCPGSGVWILFLPHGAGSPSGAVTRLSLRNMSCSPDFRRPSFVSASVPLGTCGVATLQGHLNLRGCFNLGFILFLRTSETLLCAGQKGGRPRWSGLHVSRCRVSEIPHCGASEREPGV